MCTHDWRKGERFQISRKDAHRQGNRYLYWFHSGAIMDCVSQQKAAGPWENVVQTFPSPLEELCSVSQEKLRAGTALV